MPTALHRPLRRDQLGTSLTNHPLVSRYLDSLSCHVWLTNSATVVSLNKPVKSFKKQLTTELVKPKVLNISLVAVVGIVDSVDNPKNRENSGKIKI